ncbi:MAG: DEAD/DEAH box helicase family protein, partial [Lentisphaeria bacterium]
KLESEEGCFILATHLTKLISVALSGQKGDDTSVRQVSLCNELLQVLAKYDNKFLYEEEAICDELSFLLGVQDLSKKSLVRPGTSLANAALFTGAVSDITLESELKKEIETADGIDILCSFIKWSGLRLILPSLQEATANGVKLRVITTSYLGATDLKAIEELQKLANTEIYISYNTKSTRLHAKSYIFHRKNGFGTGYIGSSNISNPALTSGLEWNLKVSEFELPYLWEKLCITFDAYEISKEFCKYEVSGKENLAKALNAERFGATIEDSFMGFMDISPYSYQKEILEKLVVEREIHKRTKNLVVAATGTGKTVIAAFDFKEVYRNDSNASFLFVVHREEILRQSLYTFRNILRDQNFGELLVGNAKADNYKQLFVSIQSFNSNNLCEKLGEYYYDYIVIDEFHHAAANSYQKLLEHFKPKYLLGLTATPERHDGLDILKYFDYHITAEIRLPDAINRKLLSPFQYFGISDCVDLRDLNWVRGGYDRTQLNIKLGKNLERANLVIEKMHKILLDVNNARGLCFCVSQEHAEFMNGVFTDNKISSAVLTASSSREERSTIQKRLVMKSINIICVVDLYNEGVDIREIDTVIFLRPTESLTVFLQQLGRGLRLHEEKDCLTVLDFVGQAHRNFNFEYRFRSMIGSSNRNIASEVKNGFPHLPAGCHIELERQAQKHILENINYSLASGKQSLLISRIATFENESGLRLNLANFINYHHLSLNAIYKKALFSRLCEKANVAKVGVIADEDRLRKGLYRIVHLNSSLQISILRKWLRQDIGGLGKISEDERRILTMLHYCIWGRKSSIGSLEESLAKIKANEHFKGELLAVLD